MKKKSDERCSKGVLSVLKCQTRLSSVFGHQNTVKGNLGTTIRKIVDRTENFHFTIKNTEVESINRVLASKESIVKK